MNLLIVDLFSIGFLAFPFLFLFVVIFAVVSLVRRAGNIDRMKEVATLLGFQFYQELDLPQEYRALVLRLELMKVQQRLYFCMKGNYNGVPVFIFATSYGNGKHSSYQTYFLGLFDKPFTDELFISKDGFFLGIATKLLGIPEVKVGDDTIDKKYYILAKQGGEISEFLHKQMVQESFDGLLSNYKSFINESGAVIVRGGNLEGNDENKIKGFLNDVTDAVRKMGR